MFPYAGYGHIVSLQCVANIIITDVTEVYILPVGIFSDLDINTTVSTCAVRGKRSKTAPRTHE